MAGSGEEPRQSLFRTLALKNSTASLASQARSGSKPRARSYPPTQLLMLRHPPRPPLPAVATGLARINSPGLGPPSGFNTYSDISLRNIKY